MFCILADNQQAALIRMALQRYEGEARKAGNAKLAKQCQDARHAVIDAQDTAAAGHSALDRHPICHAGAARQSQ
jgi:hypothetical protein